MESSKVDLVQIQQEQVAWSLRNFGAQPAHRPMLGVIEELCELELALLDEDDEDLPTEESEVLDAIGDVGIYMLDYCGKRGWSMQELWDNRLVPDDVEDFRFGDDGDGFLSVVPFIKRLAHSQLKGEQNIRGGTAVHDDVLQDTLCEVLWLLERLADAYLGMDFLQILAAVWAKVQKRDWVQNPNNAHEVAEASDPK